METLIMKKWMNLRELETEGTSLNIAPNDESYENEDTMTNVTPADEAIQENEEYLLTHAFA